MKYLNKKEIAEVLNNVSADDFVEILPKDANGVDRVKYQLCKKFIIYMQKENITQAEISRRIGVDRSRVNWIVKYKINYFTIDRLFELLSILDPSIELKVS